MRTYGYLAVSSIFLATLVGTAQAGVPAQHAKTQINDDVLVTLSGNTREEAKPANDRGPVPGNLRMEHILLQLKRSATRENALSAALGGLYDKTSPNYHHWLTPQEFGAQFGAEDKDVKTVSHWLSSHGVQVNGVYKNRMAIDFSGTAAAVGETFHTQIHYLEVNSETHMANMSDPRIPAALVGIIAGVSSLHDFHPHSQARKRAQYTVGGCGSHCYPVVPADLATIYNMTPAFNAGITGSGETIAVVEDSDMYSTADWTNFRKAFGLASYTAGNLQQIHPNCTDPGATADDLEATLDAEYASAAAPNATVELASCYGSFTFGGLVALENLVNGTRPSVISVSYGECEAYDGASTNAVYNAVYQQAAAEGVSVFVSAGDEGAADCDAHVSRATHGIGVNALASSPYDVAVGGTDFEDTYLKQNAVYWNASNNAVYGSAKSYVPEIPWNNSCASVLAATYVTGKGTTYGSSGFCNTATGEKYLTTTAGSGGPSGCATGSPQVIGVVGGSCAGYSKPAWQAQVHGNPSDRVRDLPDVSLFAANGFWSHWYITCYSDKARGGAACTGAPSGWTGAGGTSFSAPILAGVQALVNQKQGSAQGDPNPVYYSLAAAEFGTNGSAPCNSSNGNQVGSSCVFYDTTQGDMDLACAGSTNCYLPSGTNGVLSSSDTSYQPAEAAAAGWDYATGLGSINVSNLIAAWP